MESFGVEIYFYSFYNLSGDSKMEGELEPIARFVSKIKNIETFHMRLFLMRPFQ